MDDLTDKELIALLEALHIATRVAVIYPPLEHSRIYTDMDDLWATFGAEAILRGFTNYAQYYPEMEGTFSGEALGDGSDAEEALDCHDNDRFWATLKNIVATLAGMHDHGDGFLDLPGEQRRPLLSKYESKVEAVIEKEGIAGIIDISKII